METNTIPKVSLIIPAYNEEKYIEDCLASALRNSTGPSCKWHEIIVIDNASTDRTAAVAGKYPGVRVISEIKKGLTQARQRGLQEATGDLLAYVDADTRMPVNWLETALRLFSESEKQNKNMVSLSGPYRYYDGPWWVRSLQTIVWWISAPLAAFTAGFALLGGNFIAKKTALVDMGGFDTSIKFYGEDTNIARRLKPFGKVVFKMNFYIYSSARRFTTQGFIKTNVRYGLNFIWEAFLHRPFSQDYQDIDQNKKSGQNTENLLK